ncbi:MAG: tryptophan synthase subunit alpha [Nitrospiraceae bacterium]|nr:tryptophan synthase subunit alpha [Nitrospiraceae bacterium]
MSRIGAKFKELRKKNAKAFIPYIMAGDPDIGRTRELVTILQDCGADIIELGVPFSDPLADGPTIQKAAQRALQQGVTLASVIDFVADLRKTAQIPIVIMTYYNLIFKYGEERFIADAASAGIDGMIIPDLPPDEASAILALAGRSGFDIIFLLAPTSPGERIRKVARASGGFIYYVSITGITGASLSLDPAIGEHIAGIRSVSKKPIAIGFGISTPEEAAAVAPLADGVIVGSAIVKRVNDPDEELRRYLVSLRSAIR